MALPDRAGGDCRAIYGGKQPAHYVRNIAGNDAHLARDSIAARITGGSLLPLSPIDPRVSDQGTVSTILPMCVLDSMSA